MYTIHEIFVEVVAGLSRRQFRECRREAATIRSQAGWATGSPKGVIGFGRANIMLTRATRGITIRVLTSRATRVFERVKREIEEQRVQLQTLKPHG
jgi:hypothetical protein